MGCEIISILSLSQDQSGECALYAQDTVPRRHHPHHIEPMDFIARLAALVPKPRVNLTRFHGVFALNSRSTRGTCLQSNGRRRRSDGTWTTCLSRQLTSLQGDNENYWPFDDGHPFFLLFTLAVGGMFDKPHLPSADIEPQHLLVDYVRVYRQVTPTLHP